ncbi:MAG: ArnT family glycosyltransferase [Candidatus Hodarchaeales archaeon]
MKPDKVYVPLLVLITLLVCFSLLEYGFWSIDEESYEFLTRSIVKKGQLHFESDYSEIQSDLSRAYFGVVSNNKVYSVFPPGYPFLAAPFYFVWGIEGMQIANIFFTVPLILIFYLFMKRYYNETEAFIASVILLVGTQILNYSVSIWSHIPAAFFMLFSIYLLLENKPRWSGLAMGASIAVRYSGVVIVPVFLIYLYSYKKGRKEIVAFLITLLLGVSPLLFYNHAAFGSPFISGMTLLNVEEGSKVLNLFQIPKRLITNILHYTFFPELEFLPEKASLLETSPFLVFSILGVFIFMRAKKRQKTEYFIFLSSIFLFISFISTTWSLGGLAHNMRLLTDILPLITFFALIPLFYFKTNSKKILVFIIIFLGLALNIEISFRWLKFFNLVVALTSLITISFVLLFRKDISKGLWKKSLSFLLILGIGMSVFTAIHVTNLESLNRENVRAAAQTFEKAIPEGSVVFVYFGDYPMYTEHDYLFLDYSHGAEDIPRVVDYYKNKSLYVLFKDANYVKKFDEFTLTPAGPIRTYELKPK